jgi:hypothetical protein
MGITYHKSKPISYAESRREPRPQGPAATADYADKRVADAFGSSYEDYNQGVGDWMWQTAKKGASAAHDFMKKPIQPEDFKDLAQSVPSALTKVGENFLGAPMDTSEMIWSLAHAMNKGQQKLTGYDATLPLMRAQKLDRDWAPGSLPTSSELHDSAKQNLPEFMTHEPQSNLGSLLHTAADFVGPGELGAYKGLEALSGANKGRKALGRLDRLPGAPSHIEGPVPEVAKAAEDYAASRGMNLTRQPNYAVADPRRGRYIAKAYDDMPHAPNDPKVAAAYKALSDETMAQWHALQDAGIDIDFLKQGAPDPYPGGPRDALADLRNNRHLHVFPTDQGFGSSEAFNPDNNPLLAPTGIEHKGHPMVVNDAFRAVHDVFGHGLEGANFGARGEENAWRAHQRLFSKEALPALTSETRGQNSWVNFGPFGDANRANQRETIFADQKTGVMPKWTQKEGGMPLAYRLQQVGLPATLAGTLMLSGSTKDRK